MKSSSPKRIHASKYSQNVLQAEKKLNQKSNSGKNGKIAHTQVLIETSYPITISVFTNI